MKTKICAAFLLICVVLSLFSSCGKNNTSKKDDDDEHSHRYSSWQVESLPTCTKRGEEIRSCECGKVQSRSIDMVAHSYTWAVTKPATMTEPGEEKGTCVCGRFQVREIPAGSSTSGSGVDVTTDDPGVELPEMPGTVPVYKTAGELAAVIADECTNAKADRVLDAISDDCSFVLSGIYVEVESVEALVSHEVETGLCDEKTHVELLEVSDYIFANDSIKTAEELYLYLEALVEINEVSFKMEDLKFYMVVYFEGEKIVGGEGFTILVEQNNEWKLLFIILDI